MEITKRFPHALGNLAEDREIPTFPQPIIVVSDKKDDRTRQSRLTQKL
jgi:hypothetical protein